jgi:hypothetical protein
MNIYVEGGVFFAANTIEACVHAGDFPGVMNAFNGMSRAEREAACARLRSLSETVDKFYWDPPARAQHWWGAEVVLAHRRAADAALFLCGTDDDRKTLWRMLDDVVTLAPLLPPGALPALATLLIEESYVSIFQAQALVASGRSTRPVADNYVIGLITVPQRSGAHNPSLLELIDADPGLADATLLRVFEVEGSADANMSCVEKYCSGSDSWAKAFVELIRRGVYTRALLLEKTLGTLELDWPQFRAGWFSRFHTTLAPTPDEMAPLAARYARLCLSPIAPTVRIALAALSALYAARMIDAETVLQGLAPVMSSTIKAQRGAALKLHEEVVRRGDCPGARLAELLDMA